MNSKMRLALGQLGASGALVVVLVGYLMVRQPMLAADVKEGQRENTAQQQQIDSQKEQIEANAQALKQANARLIALGKAPEPVPAAPAPDGLTAGQLQAVRAVVVEELGGYTIPQAAINQISRAAGKLAQDNLQVGLPAAVKAAVGAYCVDDKCVRKGDQGERGPRGERGPKGDDAPAVTDEQLLASATQALAAYCGGDTKPCQGPTGVGVKEITCRDTDLMWVFEMTDGSFQYVRGPCRVVEESK